MFFHLACFWVPSLFLFADQTHLTACDRFAEEKAGMNLDLRCLSIEIVATIKFGADRELRQIVALDLDRLAEISSVGRIRDLLVGVFNRKIVVSSVDRAVQFPVVSRDAEAVGSQRLFKNLLLPWIFDCESQGGIGDGFA